MLPIRPDHRAYSCPTTETEVVSLTEHASAVPSLIDPSLSEMLIKVKSELDTVEPYQKARARGAVNPLETLSNHIFINRAALKASELDFLFGLLENAARLAASEADDDGGILRIADLCGGPGGFVEYCQWRTRRQAPGGGSLVRERGNRPFLSQISGLRITAITLRGKDDYRPEDFKASLAVAHRLDMPFTKEDKFSCVYGPANNGNMSSNASGYRR